jgi:hypothetical protein
MGSHKDQHWLPQLYLRRFCCDSKLWHYDRISQTYFEQPPKELAKKAHYYSVKRDDGTMDLAADDILGIAENAVAPVLSKIDSRIEISADDRATLSIFLSCLIVRVPAYLASIHADLQGTLAERTESRGGQVAMSIEKPHIMGTMLTDGLRLVELFSEFCWTIYVAAERDHFITTDTPVILLSADATTRREPAESLPTPALILVPLSSSACLAVTLGPDEMTAEGQSNISYEALPSENVLKFNAVLARHAEKYLFAHDRQLIESVVKTASI